MAYIKQRTNDDCGVACLAMLAGVSYETADEAIFGSEYSGRRYTKTAQIVAAAKKLRGWVSAARRLRPARSWERVPDNSLVKIRIPGLSRWHWVVFRKGKIYDPALGVFRSAKYRSEPSSFFHFPIQDTA